MTTTAAAAPQSSTLNFESCGGTLHELQDGHIPETFEENGQWIHYNEMNNDPSVHVYDNVLPSATVDALYDVTVQEGQPWGTYVTMNQVNDYWEKETRSPSHPLQESLALDAVAHFLKTMTSGAGAATATATATATIPSTAALSPAQLLLSDTIHGVAVWALASDSREVQYHVDYAELIRYEHNVLATPIWAGTLQCTSHPLEGGKFAVNLGGMDHYQHHGYKGNKSGDAMGGWSNPSPITNTVDWDEETGWVTIPYHYNRMIGHSGHLPHLSAPFVCHNGQYRVILGFNVFRNDVGPRVSQAPEHSHAFRRRIQCHRVLLLSNKKKHMSLKSIRQNKALTKLLVLAKREKVKADLRVAQQKLDEELERIFLKVGSIKVETLMNRWGRVDGEWPSAIDVQVHLQRRVREGTVLCDAGKKVTFDSILQLNPSA